MQVDVGHAGLAHALQFRERGGTRGGGGALRPVRVLSAAALRRWPERVWARLPV